METINKISLIGMGGIGCAYGSKLHDLDSKCLSVIASGERLERYRKQGFYINDRYYDFNYITPEQKVESADLIIISVKFNELNQAIKDIRNHVGEKTIILSLLNGISSEKIIAKEYSSEKLLYAMCIGIDAVREGNRVKFSSRGKLTFGEKSNKILSERVIGVRELFEKADISYEIPEDMIRTLWYKYMINVGINQCSAVLRAPYGVFQNTKEARKLMIAAMREVIAISKKVGIDLSERDLDEWTKVLNGLNPENKTSMLQDVEAGRKTEVEMFSGAVCEMGIKYGVETPVNSVLFNIIRSIEQNY